MRYCGDCGYENAVGAYYCVYCGEIRPNNDAPPGAGITISLASLRASPPTSTITSVLPQLAAVLEPTALQDTVSEIDGADSDSSSPTLSKFPFLGRLIALLGGIVGAGLVFLSKISFTQWFSSSTGSAYPQFTSLDDELRISGGAALGIILMSVIILYLESLQLRFHMIAAVVRLLVGACLGGLVAGCVAITLSLSYYGWSWGILPNVAFGIATGIGYGTLFWFWTSRPYVDNSGNTGQGSITVAYVLQIALFLLGTGTATYLIFREMLNPWLLLGAPIISAILSMSLYFTRRTVSLTVLGALLGSLIGAPIGALLFATWIGRIGGTASEGILLGALCGLCGGLISSNIYARFGNKQKPKDMGLTMKSIRDLWREGFIRLGKAEHRASNWIPFFYFATLAILWATTLAFLITFSLVWTIIFSLNWLVFTLFKHYGSWGVVAGWTNVVGVALMVLGLCQLRYGLWIIPLFIIGLIISLFVSGPIVSKFTEKAFSWSNSVTVNEN